MFFTATPFFLIVYSTLLFISSFLVSFPPWDCGTTMLISPSSLHPNNIFWGFTSYDSHLFLAFLNLLYCSFAFITLYARPEISTLDRYKSLISLVTLSTESSSPCSCTQLLTGHFLQMFYSHFRFCSTPTELTFKVLNLFFPFSLWKRIREWIWLNLILQTRHWAIILVFIAFLFLHLFHKSNHLPTPVK